MFSTCFVKCQICSSTLIIPNLVGSVHDYTESTRFGMPNLTISVCYTESVRFGGKLDFKAVDYTDTTSIGIGLAEPSSIGVQYTDTASIGVTETRSFRAISVYVCLNKRKSHRRVLLRVINYRGCRILK